MVFRMKIGLLAAFAGLLMLSPNGVTADEKTDKTQVAVSQGHLVTFDINVNNGDYVSAKEVLLQIEPMAGNKNAALRASLKGPGKVELPEGKYKITAQLLETQVEERFEVLGPTTHTVSVTTGFATLKWITNIGKKPIKDEVQWRILTYKRYENNERRVIAVLNGSQPRLALPQGWYIAEGTYDGLTKRLAIEVANGVQYDYVLCANC